MKPLLLILLFAIPTFSQITVHRDTKYPFALSYDAKTWEEAISSLPDTRIALEQTFVSFTIRARPVPKGIAANLAEGYKKHKNVFLESYRANALPGAVIRSSGITYVAGREAVFVTADSTYRLLDESIELTQHGVSVVYEGNLYILTCTIPKELFDGLFGECKELYGSFGVIPKILQEKPTAKRVKP